MANLKTLAVPMCAITILALASCGTNQEEATVSEQKIVVSQEQGDTTASGSAEKIVSSEPYVKRELSKEELDGYSLAMGVELANTGTELGKLFLNVDWDSKNTTGKATSVADSGRKISLGFSNLYSDAVWGWGRGFIEYSTYDFSIGSSYSTFATRGTFDSAKNGQEKHTILVDGVKGVVTYQFEPAFEEPSKIQKIVAFPMADHYVAVVYTLAGDYSKTGEMIIQELYDGTYPQNEMEGLNGIDRFVSTLKFVQK